MASNKFEEMLEKLVNEDKAGAEELFHEIVVEKSRDIYEGLLESDLEVDETKDEEVDEASDEEVDEASKDDDKEVDEASSSSDEDGGLWYASGLRLGLLDAFLETGFFNFSPLALGSASLTSFFLCLSSFDTASFFSLFLLFFMFFWLTVSEMVELSLMAF